MRITSNQNDFIIDEVDDIDPDYSSDYYYDWDAYHQKYGILTHNES